MAWRSSTDRAVAALMIVTCACANAQDAAPAPKTINLVTPVRYADDATATLVVREHCELERTVQADVLDALHKRGRTVDEVASREGGEALDVSIHRVQGLGPWAGPKTLAVLVHTYKDGKATHVKMLSAYGNGWPLEGACSVLQRDSKTVAQRLVDWLDGIDAAPASVPAATASQSTR